jgi:glycosyltransferase involved in cell wall biosynthesis
VAGNRPPHVALLPSAFAPHLGGVEELSRRLAIELRTRGSDTVVITNRWPVVLPAQETIDGVPVRRERFRFPEPRPRHLAGWVVGTRATRRGVLAAMAEHSAELVHVQCVSSNGYYALRAARSLRLPLVVSMQGELTMDAAQIYQRSAAMRHSWRRLVRAADVVTGCSQQVLDEAVAVYGPGLASKARVIRNGVDVAAVRAAEPFARARPYLLGIGRLVAQKGFDTLLAAFAQLAGEHSELDLLLAGEGPERAALERQARAAGLQRRVEFLGGVPAAQAFRLFRGATAFVLPSRHEPQGIVVVEAMAAGAPVVATRVGGVPETIQDGTNGLLTEPDDAAALAKTLREVLDDPAAADARAAQAGIDVEAYDWRRITDQYERCYADALASRDERGRG